MLESANALYKLMILYALEQVTVPLTRVQVSELMLSNDYADYLRTQEVLSELVETGLLAQKQALHMTSFSITPAGKETLRFFQNELSVALRRDIRAYLQAHAAQLRRTAQVTADYTRTKDKDYLVRGAVYEGPQLLMELRVTAPTERAAQILAENWRAKNEEVYGAVMNILRGASPKPTDGEQSAEPAQEEGKET